MNEKVYTATIGVIGGTLSWLFGGFDTLMMSLIVLIILDYITGVIKGAMQKELSSDIGLRGIAKKLVILILVALAVVVQRSILTSLPIREMLITFFVANEALSVLENAQVIVPSAVPKWLTKLLKQVKKDAEKGSEKDENKDIH